jgi:hypothetical protein
LQQPFTAFAASVLNKAGCIETANADNGDDGAPRRRITKGRLRTGRAQASPRTARAPRRTAEATSAIVGTPAHATVPQPIFAFVTAPKVMDVTHEGLTKWMDLRLEYEEAIKARCENTGKDINAVLVSVRNSFEETLLDTMCEAVWAVKKDDITDTYLWDWVMATVESFKNRTFPNIEELFLRELAMNQMTGDVEAEVTNYFHVCNNIIRTNGLSALFKGEDGTKQKCKSCSIRCLAS